MNKTCASAIAGIGFIASLVNSALAQPNLSNDFTADITVTYLGKQTLTQQYTWYESQANRLSRVDFVNPLGSFKVLQLFPNTPLHNCTVEGRAVVIPTPTRNGIEYTYNTNRNACWRTAIPRGGFVLLPIPHFGDTGFWDVLANATIAGACQSNGNNSGTHWLRRLDQANQGDQYKEISVCVASDNRTPYWASFTGTSKACRKQYPGDKGKPCTLVRIDFNSYEAGVPALDNFCPGSLAEARACGISR